MMEKVIRGILLSAMVALQPLSAHAVEVKKQGLYLSPTRQEVSVAPGHTVEGSLQLADYTTKPLTVNLSVRQFTVLDYSYDYKFGETQNEWVKFANARLELQPQQESTVKYEITVPTSAAPGGHYLAIFASAGMSNGGIAQTGQLVSLVFLKVSGKLVQSGVISNGYVPFLNMGNEIIYKFDAKNTGNVHYDAAFYGQLESVFGKSQEYGTTHVLMPGAARTVSGSVPAPLLPGIYKLNYGYKTDNSVVSSKSDYVLFIPPWFIVALLIIGAGIVKQRRARSRSDKDKR